MIDSTQRKSSGGCLFKILVFIGLFLISFCLFDSVPIHILFLLAFGWLGYLARVLPLAHLSLPGAGMSLLCALLILIAGHTTARWLYQHLTSNQPYKLRWTFQGLLVIALMFAAGMGATGIAHQTGWLFHDGHLYTYGFRTQLAYQAKCATNMRQLGTCLQLFATAHNNHLPDDLTELADYDIDPDVFVCRASDDTKAEGATTQQWVANLKTPGSRHCSYIYLGKGLTWPVPAETPLLTESLSNHDDKGMNVLFGDGHVEFIEPDQIKSLRFPP